MNTVPAKITNMVSSSSLPDTLQTLERHLQQIQQEQLSKNQARLSGFSSVQKQEVELLTMAIIQGILKAIADGCEDCAVADKGGQVSAIVSSMWKLGGATGDIKSSLDEAKQVILMTSKRNPIPVGAAIFLAKPTPQNVKRIDMEDQRPSLQGTERKEKKRYQGRGASCDKRQMTDQQWSSQDPAGMCPLRRGLRIPVSK